MSILEKILKSVVLDEATIIEKTKLSQSAYKIRLYSESIKNSEFIPGSFLRMGIGLGNKEVAMKDKIRSYSIWDINQGEGLMDLAIATHSNGIGTQWIKNCQVHDTVHFKVKKGNFLADENADSYLMIGDLSALSHLYAINRHIGKGKQVSSIVYSQNQSELFPDIDGNSPFDFYEMNQNPSEQIISILKEIAPSFKGKKLAYIAGDSRVCITLNQYLKKELNWEVKALRTKPFWNPDKKGLE